MDKQLESTARKLAGEALRPYDVLLDLDVGKLKRLRSNGAEKAVARKGWLNTLPPTRGMMILTYTWQQALFLADGLGVNCPLVQIHRTQLLDNQNQLFAFTRDDGTLTILEFEPAGRAGRSAQPGRLVNQLLTTRDAVRAKLSAEERETLERIDLLVQRLSLDKLWAMPPAPFITEAE